MYSQDAHPVDRTLAAYTWTPGEFDWLIKSLEPEAEWRQALPPAQAKAFQEVRALYQEMITDSRRLGDQMELMGGPDDLGDVHVEWFPTGFGARGISLPTFYQD
jgi:hypothetical protein